MNLQDRISPPPTVQRFFNHDPWRFPDAVDFLVASVARVDDSPFGAWFETEVSDESRAKRGEQLEDRWLLSAVTALTNLANTGNTGPYQTEATYWSSPVAQAFTTGTSDLVVTSVTLGMGASPGITGSSQPLVVAIYTNTTGAAYYNGAGATTTHNLPGSIVGSAFTATTSATPIAAGNYVWTPASPLTLTANTPYWLVASTTNATSGGAFYNWLYDNNSADPTAQGGWTVPNTSSSDTNAGFAQPSSGLTVGWYVYPQVPQLFSITANAAVSVNHAPSGANKTVTINEDTTYTFATSDFGFTDPNDSPANNLLAVKINALTPAGTLTDNGSPVQGGDFIPVADITGGKLKFTPVADANGTGYGFFAFSVQDDGGTSGGGVNLDQTPNTFTVNVTAVADITNDSLTVNENAPVTANVITGTLGATADSFENSGAVITGVTNGTHGSVTFNANGNVTYTPNNNSTSADSFTYTVTSGGATETGTVNVTVNALTGVTQLGGVTSQYIVSDTLSGFTVPAGTKRLLVVAASDPNSTGVDFVTFGGTQMQYGAQITPGLFGNIVDSIWFLPLGDSVSPQSGDIVMTSSGTAERFLSAVVFSGVDQTHPIVTDAGYSSGFGSDGPTVDVTSQPGDLVFDLLDNQSSTAANVTVGANQTFLADQSAPVGPNGFSRYATSTEAGASTVTMSWTSDSDYFLQSSINIKQAKLSDTFGVTTLADENDPGATVASPGGAGLSLREAIALANADPIPSTITFASSLFTSGDQIITLTKFDTGLDNGEFGPSAFIISANITIDGPTGNNGLTIERASGNANKFRLFHVQATGNLTLDSLTLSGGLAKGGDGINAGGGAAGMGGAIFNQGTLTITNSLLTGNQAIGGEGADAGTGGGGGGGVGGNATTANGGGPNGGTSGALNGGFGGGGAGATFVLAVEVVAALMQTAVTAVSVAGPVAAASTR
jgi:hypothetical protein